MKLTTHDVFDKLLNDDKILDLSGQIRFFLGDVDIIVRQKDVVGNIIARMAGRLAQEAEGGIRRGRKHPDAAGLFS